MSAWRHVEVGSIPSLSAFLSIPEMTQPDAAKADEKIGEALAGKPIKRAIVIKGRLANLII